MTKDIKRIQEAMNLLVVACDNIIEGSACEKCPLYSDKCLDDMAVKDFAEEMTTKSLEEFLGFADDVQEYLEELEINSEENQRALHADFQRKYEAEERMIDEWGL